MLCKGARDGQSSCSLGEAGINQGDPLWIVISKNHNCLKGNLHNGQKLPNTLEVPGHGPKGAVQTRAWQTSQESFKKTSVYLISFQNKLGKA